jgi:hypothetical protein
MKKSGYILFTVLLLFLLKACFYSDTDIYYVDPVPGDPPEISVSTNLDTLINPQVNDSLKVIYTAEVVGGEYYYVYASVHNILIYESDLAEGSFWIQSSLADSSGVDTLLMQFYYSTNTNSLADLAGYDALEKKVKIAVDFNLENLK